MITFDNVSKVYPDGTVAVDKLTLTAARQNDTITKTLNAVSANFTTQDLITMNAAKKWLAGVGIS
jgi:hypothetical protein